MDAVCYHTDDDVKPEANMANGFGAHSRIFNKRLSRVILYGRRKQDLVDRRSVLQRCVEEIGRVRDSDRSECGELPSGLLAM